jgi:uncharacterized OsmC-like protein
MTALVGCTNVITHKVAHKNGVDIKSMNIRFEAQFDRRGVTLQEEIERPFTAVTLTIDLQTDADAAAVERVKRELAMFCPVSKVLRKRPRPTKTSRGRRSTGCSRISRARASTTESSR